MFVIKNKIDKIKQFFKKSNKKQKAFMIAISLFLMTLLILIPMSLASLEPVRKITILSEMTNYEGDEPSAWKIEKSGQWTNVGEAKITFDLESVLKKNYKYTDILLVLDTSGSMVKDKLENLKSDTIELMNHLIDDNGNKAGIITFDTNSTIASNLTDDKESLINIIQNLTAGEATNYYRALENVDTILRNYKREEDRQMIVLFLTDGYPNEDTPNEVGQYQYLKDTYPFIIINGIQYEMGDTLLDPIKKVSDHQYIADMENLHNVLLDAAVAPEHYETFEITDFIDTNYFYVESPSDINASKGKVSLDEEAQTVTWNLSDLISGQDAKMTIKIKLKEEYLNRVGIYPTNTKEVITSKLGNIEENITSTKTPVLADNYKVIYEGNAPEGCSVEEVPEEKHHSVFETVPISEKKMTCEGYEFRGWSFATKEVNKLNADYFTMPESDVILRATWGKVGVNKSMEGTVSVIQRLYNMMADLAVPDDEASEFVTSSSGIDFSKVPSNTNGKGVYTLASTKNDEFPVHYFRGNVTTNNVKFGGFCWKIVRTTSTGGVKMIYNGEPDEYGYCSNKTGDATQIGESKFSSNGSSPALVGYMYGNIEDYLAQEKVPVWYEHIGRSLKSYSQLNLYFANNKTYYYADTITWDSGTKSYVFSNSNGSEVGSENWNNETHQRFNGKYICIGGTPEACTAVRYIAGTSPYYGYYIPLSNGQNLEDLNETRNYGEEIRYENGVYTILNPTERKRINWYTDYPKHKGNYVCADGTTSCSTIWYIVATTDSVISYVEMNGGETYDSLYEEALNTPWIYGNDVEWDGEKYILKDTVESSPLNWSKDWNKIATKYHYTCFSTENNCREVGYIHYFNSRSGIMHLKLKNGKTMEDAKKEMFANTTSSPVKTEIDTWYQKNMLAYTNSLEDTIWCNDRSIARGPLKSKDEDSSLMSGANQSNQTIFGANIRNYVMKNPSVICPNDNDKFTVSSENGNGDLTYPVALLTADEMTLAGHGNAGQSISSYLYTNKYNWSLSPSIFDSRYARIFYLAQEAYLIGLRNSGEILGVRPAISLAPETIIASGDGTDENPFLVEKNTLKK